MQFCVFRDVDNLSLAESHATALGLLTPATGSRCTTRGSGTIITRNRTITSRSSGAIILTRSGLTVASSSGSTASRSCCAPI